jgi:DNA polymerase type B, organellar and viral
MDEFSSKIYIEFNAQLTDALTISRLALNIYLNKYLKDHQIPIISKYDMFKFIQLGYYGGITEVYKPYGENLIYIDVNSLYPHAALNPMPGHESQYLESLDEKGLDLENIFGFFYAKIKTNDKYLGLLPVKSKTGLILPIGEFEGV